MGTPGDSNVYVILCSGCSELDLERLAQHDLTTSSTLCCNTSSTLSTTTRLGGQYQRRVQRGRGEGKTNLMEIWQTYMYIYVLTCNCKIIDVCINQEQIWSPTPTFEIHEHATGSVPKITDCAEQLLWSLSSMCSGQYNIYYYFIQVQYYLFPLRPK